MASTNTTGIFLTTLFLLQASSVLASGCPKCSPFSVCVGTAHKKRCVVPVDEEGSCLKSRFTVCKKGLICAGTPTEKRCVLPLPKGSECKGSPFKICKEPLECRDGVCKRPALGKGEKCSLVQGFECMKGLTCAGPPSNKRCVVPMSEGKTCKKDPYWVCVEGLECRRQVCKKPRVPERGPCKEKGSECEEGLICAGTKKNKRCVVPMPEGKPCKKDPFWVCIPDLECRDNICKKPRVPERGPCKEKGSECEEGLICAGTKKNKRCVVPMPEGKPCKKDPFWVCGPGLECRDNICKKPRVPERGPCKEKGSECEEGLICAGTKKNKRCVVPMPEGKPCKKDPFWVCGPGLECRDYICKTPLVPKRGPCKDTEAECEKGLVCAGPSVNKRCVTPMPEGKPCKKDPYWVCVDGLTCTLGICRK